MNNNKILGLKEEYEKRQEEFRKENSLLMKRKQTEYVIDTINVNRGAIIELGNIIGDLEELLK